MRQSTCLVVNLITVNNFAALFMCTSASHASDLMKASAYNLIKLVGARYSVFGTHRGSTIGFLLLQSFSVGLAVEYSCCFISVLNRFLFFFFLFCFLVLRAFKIISIHFEPCQLQGGAETGDPREKKHMTTRKQNSACQTCDPSDVLNLGLYVYCFDALMS